MITRVTWMLLLGLAGVVYPEPEGAAILSTLYGYDGCIGGVNNFDTEEEYIEDLRRRKCSVVTNPRTGEITHNVAASQLVSIACGGATIEWKDGMPVVFNYPIIGGPRLPPDTFEIELSDGSRIVPDCIALGPANEANELDTALVIGDLGDGYGETLNPVKVKVVGELVLQGPNGELNATGISFSNPDDMDYLSGSLRMVYARLWNVEDFDESALRPPPGAFYPNNCESIFPDTTHVLRVAFSGGPTSDGVTSIEPTNTQLFTVVNTESGEAIPYLGLADLGRSVAGVEGQAYAQDGDNYVDICMDLAENELPVWLALDLECNLEIDSSLYPPKGKPFSCVSQQVILTEEAAYGYFSRAWQTPV